MTSYDQQMTTTGVLELLDTNKSQRESFVEDLLMRMDGGVNPLKVHVQIKCMQELIERLLDSEKYPKTAKRYKGMILSEAEKYGKKFEFHSATIQQKEVGVKLDWSKTEDSKIIDLLIMQETLEERIKARQEFLKTVPDSGLVITDEETGETRKVFKPAKSSTTSISVSLK